MPLYKDIPITPQGRIGIWKVEETLDELYDLVPSSIYTREQVEKQFRCLDRKIEFVAVRVLLYHLLKKEKRIEYYPSGRPYLLDECLFISISHTKGYVALALSKTMPIGIDIERYGEKINKVKDRVVGVEEHAESLYELLLHWSAKESVFKALGTSGVDFIKHLKVSKLNCKANSSMPIDMGAFKLEVSLPGKKTIFDIGYFTESDFVLTYTGISTKS